MQDLIRRDRRRAAIESRFGWTLMEQGDDGVWSSLGEVDSGDEAERWVGLTSVAPCATVCS